MQAHVRVHTETHCDAQRSQLWQHVLVALLVACSLTLWLTTTARAGTIQVDGIDCTLPEAITSANADSAAPGCVFEGTPGDDLLVLTPGATYVLTTTVANSTGTPNIGSTITISGTDSIITRDPSYTCESNLFRIFRVVINGDLTLHNLTVQNGCVNDEGGAIYVTGGKLTLSDVTVQLNRAQNTKNGGAIYSRNNSGIPGQVTILNSAILSNTATNHGGAIFANINNKVTLLDSSLISNTATANGGAIFLNNDSTALISGTLFLHNYAFAQGGAIFNEGGTTLAITATQVISNQATTDGGGLYNDVGGTKSAVIAGTAFISNTANNGGGIFNGVSSTLVLEGVTLENNSGGAGGALFNQAAANLIANRTLFLANRGAIGAGIFNNRGTVALHQSWLRQGFATGNGGGLFSNGNAVALTDSYVVSNTAQADGGGLFNNTTAGMTGTMTLAGSYVLSNTAIGDGGGIAVNDKSILTLTATTIAANVSGGNGGGIHNQSGITGRVTMTNAQILSNTAGNLGGGIFNDVASPLILDQTRLAANSTGNGGGAIFNNALGTLLVNNSELDANHAAIGAGIFNNRGTVNLVNSWLTRGVATGNGGGLFSNGNQVTLTASHILSNTAGGSGGGLFNNSTNGTTGWMTVRDSYIVSNTATQEGGGVANHRGSYLAVEGTQVSANRADGNGGGLYNGSGRVAITTTQLLANQATAGSALASDGSSTLGQSCIVGNAYLAVVATNVLTPVSGIGNWWGAPDGPSGAGAGSGDGVSGGVDFTNFLTSATLGCPTYGVALQLAKTVEPAGALLPGQPLTYTVTITNAGSDDGNNIRLAELLPSDIDVTTILTENLNYDSLSNFAQVAHLTRMQTATIQLAGRVAPTLTVGQAITNSVVISHVLLPALQTAHAVNLLTLPAVAWSSEAYTTSEASGTFTATLVIQPPNPYTTVTVPIAINGTGQTLEVAPGHATWPVPIAIPNDAMARGDASLALAILDASGGTVGVPSRALLTVVEDDRAGMVITPAALTLVGTAGSGTLRVTLTSEPTSTVSITLAPGSAFCTVTPNPLILDNTNWQVGATAIVSATNIVPNRGAVACDLGVTLSSSDPAYHGQFSQNVPVTILTGDILGLAVSKQVSTAQAQAGQTITYTYRITNTGAATLLKLQAVDDKFGAVPGLATTLISGASSSAVMTYQVQLSDLPGPLVNRVVVTGQNATSDTVTVSTTAAVDLFASTVAWSAAAYTTTEASGNFTATLLVQPPNPYVTVTAQVNLSDAQRLSTQALQEIVIPPGVSSYPVVVPIADDQLAAGNRAMQLEIVSATNARVASTRGVTLTIVDEDSPGVGDELGLAVSKLVSHASAIVGQTITYTYRITNTGEITLIHITATDDKLGEVAGLAGTLAPGETSRATLTYQVQQSDLPGPLMNTVTVRGQNANQDTDAFVTSRAVASVNVSAPTSLPDDNPPAAPATIYLPKVRR